MKYRKIKNFLKSIKLMTKEEYLELFTEAKKLDTIQYKKVSIKGDSMHKYRLCFYLFSGRDFICEEEYLDGDHTPSYNLLLSSLDNNEKYITLPCKYMLSPKTTIIVKSIEYFNEVEYIND
jgi:hypothetical protein